AQLLEHHRPEAAGRTVGEQVGQVENGVAVWGLEPCRREEEVAGDVTVVEVGGVVLEFRLAQAARRNCRQSSGAELECNQLEAAAAIQHLRGGERLRLLSRRQPPRDLRE